MHSMPPPSAPEPSVSPALPEPSETAAPLERWPDIERALVALVLAAAGYAALCFAIIAGARFAVPYELEWLEGLEFLHALRVQEGLAWYPEPSLEFLPSVYPPGYKIVSAGLMWLFGNHLSVMRAASIACTAISVLAIFGIVRRHTGQAFHGSVAGGLFLASYAVCGSWFDLARVDMLALALALGGIALAHRDSSRGSFAVGIAAVTLSCLVKQTNLAFVAGVLGIWLLWNWRRALAAAAAVAATLGSAILALQRVSNGWYLVYTWDLPGSVPREWERLRHAIFVELPSLAGWTAPLLIAAIWWVVAKRRWQVMPVLLLPVALVVSLFPRSAVGAYLNNLISVSAFVAIAAGIGLYASTRPGRWVRTRVAVGFALVLGQFGALAYDVPSRLPHPRDVEIAGQVIKRLGSLDAPVLAPYHPYLLHLAGHEPHLHFHMVNEYLVLPGSPGERLRASIETSLYERRWQSLVSTQYVNGQELLWGSAGHMGRNSWPYRRVGSLIPTGDRTALFPLTGNRVRPLLVYRPTDAPASFDTPSGGASPEPPPSESASH